jgi:hypothetical protein
MTASEEPASEGPRQHRRKPVDASGRERPRFLLDFPEDPELERLIGAFEAGDYAEVRRLAPRVVKAAASPAVKDAAREIRRRIEPDPLIRYLLFAAVGLFVVIVAYVYTNHAH